MPRSSRRPLHVSPGAVLALEIDNAAELKRSHREMYDALIECAAFVNWRRLEKGDRPVLALSFNV